MGWGAPSSKQWEGEWDSGFLEGKLAKGITFESKLKISNKRKKRKKNDKIFLKNHNKKRMTYIETVLSHLIDSLIFGKTQL